MFNVYDIKYYKKKDLFVVCYSDGAFCRCCRHFKTADFVKFIDKCMNIQFAINLLKDSMFGDSEND